LRRNQIHGAEFGGVVVTAHDAKTRALTAHLRGLLGVAEDTAWSFDLDGLYRDAARPNAAAMTAPFTEGEERMAVRAMNRNSSPGPDGFGPGFYAAAWHVAVPTVMAFAEAFQARTVDLERLNRAYIVMLPKHQAALKPGDYRPICMQNCSLKIVAKMLTTRLQVEIPNLIDLDQTSFIKGRSISENFIYAVELVQCCHRRKIPTLVLKLDFAKAFDSVDWGSLDRVLAVRGFPQLGAAGSVTFSLRPSLLSWLTECPGRGSPASAGCGRATPYRPTCSF
jgi:hypothetical protein